MADYVRPARSLIAGIIAALLLTLVQTALPGEESMRASNQDARTSPGPAMFCGERLHYEICFWLFRNAAAGQLTFTKTPRGYEALFEAETSGLIRAIAGSRKEVMRSVMQFDEETGRLRPLLFQELSTDGRREIDKTLTFNYTGNSYTVAIEVNNQRVLYRTKKLPEGICEDLLSLYYNFRMGHYGPAQPGMALQVDLLMSVRTSRLDIMLRDHENGKRCADYYYAVVNMEKNLTLAGSGRVSGRLSRDLIPLYGVIEDAYYFGDLRASLTGREFIKTMPAGE